MQVANAAPTTTMLTPRAAWPDLPFKASGRDIVSTSGSKIVYAGVNWPGAADAMLPEGLQYNSISNIVGLIKSLDMNVVRLTFAIEMIDDIYDDSPDQTLEATLVKALGQQNGTAVLGQILEHNPTFTEETTRLEVCEILSLSPPVLRLTVKRRSSTLWLLSLRSKRFGSISTITSPKRSGAAVQMMAMLGLVVRTCKETASCCSIADVSHSHRHQLRPS